MTEFTTRRAVTIELGNSWYALNGDALADTSIGAATTQMQRTSGTEDLSADGLGLILPNAADEIIQQGLALC